MSDDIKNPHDCGLPLADGEWSPAIKSKDWIPFKNLIYSGLCRADIESLFRITKVKAVIIAKSRQSTPNTAMKNKMRILHCFLHYQLVATYNDDYMSTFNKIVDSS